FQSQLGRLAFATQDDPVFHEATSRALELIDAAGSTPRMTFLKSRNTFRVALFARHNRKPDDALTLFQETVRLAPKWAKARFELARSFAHHGSVERAAEQARQALVLDESLAPARQLLEKLSRLSGARPDQERMVGPRP
ncbi:MAG: hypothetical protein AAF658_06130, partial [Myxococcota bacterium]